MKQDDGMAATVNRAAEAGRAPFYDKAKTKHLARCGACWAASCRPSR